MRIGTETASLVNHLYSRMVVGEPEPYVGMPATLLSWTDRNPATVVEVNMTKRYIVVQADKYTRTDNNGMSESQTYVYERDPEGSTYYYRKMKNGTWREHRINPDTKRFVKSGGSLSLGKRERYYDFSF